MYQVIHGLFYWINLHFLSIAFSTGTRNLLHRYSKSAVPTSVESVNVSQEEVNGGNYIYDLCGRRVETPVNGGVYIMNGKVVVIK